MGGKAIRKCEICGVRRVTKGTSGIFLARFPLEPNRCREWVRVVGNEDLAYVPIEKIHQLKFVCGKHFTPKDFNRKHTQLRKWAVPSVDLRAKPLPDDVLIDFPSHIAEDGPVFRTVVPHNFEHDYSLPPPSLQVDTGMTAKEAPKKQNVRALVKEKGALVKEKGALVKEKGALVKEKGALVKEKGALVKEKGALVKEKGALLKEKGALVKEKGAPQKSILAQLKEITKIVSGGVDNPHTSVYAVLNVKQPSGPNLNKVQNEPNPEFDDHFDTNDDRPPSLITNDELPNNNVKEPVNVPDKPSNPPRNWYVEYTKLKLRTDKLLKKARWKPDKLLKKVKPKPKKLNNKEIFEKLTVNLNPLAKKFFWSQIILSKRKKVHGRRFSIEEKILALSLTKLSPACYKILQNVFHVPSQRTLHILFNSITNHTPTELNQSNPTDVVDHSDVLMEIDVPTQTDISTEVHTELMQFDVLNTAEQHLNHIEILNLNEHPNQLKTPADISVKKCLLPESLQNTDIGKLLDSALNTKRKKKVLQNKTEQKKSEQCHRKRQRLDETALAVASIHPNDTVGQKKSQQCRRKRQRLDETALAVASIDRNVKPVTSKSLTKGPGQKRKANIPVPVPGSFDPTPLPHYYKTITVRSTTDAVSIPVRQVYRYFDSFGNNVDTYATTETEERTQRTPETEWW